MIYDRHTDPLWPIIRWMIFIVVVMVIFVAGSVGFFIFR
jgi:hypothetical protein